MSDQLGRLVARPVASLTSGGLRCSGRVYVIVVPTTYYLLWRSL